MCYVHENKISSSMASISIVDPLISASPSERKKHIKLLLKEILDEYSSYLKQAKEMDSYKVTRHDMAFVLINMKLSIVRARPAFSELDQNVLFYHAKTLLEDTIVNFQNSHMGLTAEDYGKLGKIKANLQHIVDNITF